MFWIALFLAPSYFFFDKSNTKTDKNISPSSLLNGVAETNKEKESMIDTQKIIEFIASIDNVTILPKFDNPFLTLKILEYLEPILPAATEINDRFPEFSADLPFYQDSNYCIKSRSYFVTNSEELFLYNNIYTDHSLASLIRFLVIPRIGHDIHFDDMIMKEMAPSAPRFKLGPKISSYFNQFLWPKNYSYGLQYGCSHQLINQLVGINASFSKSYMASANQKYMKKYKDKPLCQSDFMPETFKLHNKKQCKIFFEYLNSKDYVNQKMQTPIVFIQKQLNGQHRGRGISILDNEAEISIKKIYQEGLSCEVISDRVLMQKYIANPLMIQGHKFDFRVYMLVASTNPLIIYYYDGFLRVSLYKYDIYSKERAVHLTNTDISKEIFELARQNGKWGNKTEVELRDFQMWNFTRFADYLISVGRVKSRDWIDNYLRPEIQRAMVHIVRMTKNNIPKVNNMYQLCGMDFIFDENLKLWFIEANIKPSLQGTNLEKTKFMMRMLSDHFEIMYGLLRSRMKRIINFVNFIIRKVPKQIIMKIGIDKLSVFNDLKKEFNIINSNKMESEYEPEKNNKWIKILDENLKGMAKYKNLIDKSCL